MPKYVILLVIVITLLLARLGVLKGWLAVTGAIVGGVIFITFLIWLGSLTALAILEIRVRNEESEQ